ncbi:MAG: hypothetical protein SF187_11120 [Deltaproteobacteria bacterium]|nr:hypothetical protein [Deltaproteobacteria bacterium]
MSSSFLRLPLVQGPCHATLKGLPSFKSFGRRPQRCVADILVDGVLHEQQRVCTFAALFGVDPPKAGTAVTGPCPCVEAHNHKLPIPPGA